MTSFTVYDGMDSAAGTLDFHRKRNEYWRRIRAACQDRPEDVEPHRWLEQQWGIKPIMENGMISDEYYIADEKKYLIFLLKFG
jgi:hypothetical protein